MSKGHAKTNMVLGPFAETKGPRAPGRKTEKFKPNSKTLRLWNFFKAMYVCREMRFSEPSIQDPGKKGSRHERKT
jgi:hypothetical protein